MQASERSGMEPQSTRAHGRCRRQSQGPNSRGSLATTCDGSRTLVDSLRVHSLDSPRLYYPHATMCWTDRVFRVTTLRAPPSPHGRIRDRGQGCAEFGSAGRSKRVSMGWAFRYWMVDSRAAPLPARSCVNYPTGPLKVVGLW